MAKTKISQYDTTAANNTDINSINIAEGMAPSDVNNAIRELMAELKNFQTGASSDNLTVGGNLAVTGTTAMTGAATAPTPISSDNSTNIATTAYVVGKVGTLGTMSSQNASAVAITGGTITGLGSALPVASGGTGATASTGTGSVVLDTSPTLATPTITSPTITGASVSAMNSSVITTVTAIATTSGTSIPLSTSIPAWVKRITLMFNGTANNGTSVIQVQLGSGSIQTTGYTGISTEAQGVGILTGTTVVSGFPLGASNLSTYNYYGNLMLCNHGSNVWTASGTFSQTTNRSMYTAGQVLLSGALDRITITTVGGATAFTAGSIGILYE